MKSSNVHNIDAFEDSHRSELPVLVGAKSNLFRFGKEIQ
ncbi:hypothetical protein CSB95_3876 [Pseudomonas aeruginosa]|nr:hypothetical protein CSB94_5873 [Pseudomonas aeruginosa]EFQ38906.1 hypothetical protein PA39016_001030074 [Pseudomonas aeruginosa 39016]SMZ50530.1 hypothetical protein PANN_26930 [Pseudomonas aeruginosa C-NN2]AVK11738.1 hypothetical protein CSB91_0558 [Pseudomonas aeruginosa]AVK17922.1 hypothetical protein CSB90_4318 [Pseudomonas aeruginosa]